MLAVNGTPVESFADIARALQRAVAAGQSENTFDVELPLTNGEGRGRCTVSVTLSQSQMDHLQEMQWDLPVVVNLFEPEMTVLKASGPLDAIAMGLHETDRVMHDVSHVHQALPGSISPKNSTARSALCTRERSSPAAG